MNMYDVVIIGGGTAGCACAYNCATLGLKTLLIERSGCLGGTMTAGLVIPVMKAGDSLINQDFYNKLISEMRKYNGQITYQNNPGWFNPELLKIILDKILIEAGVEILFNTDIKDVAVSNSTIKSISCACTDYVQILSANIDTLHADNINKSNKELLVYIGAKYYVDSTGNLNFCQKINCNFLENKKEFPPMSLRFIMGGVDLDTFGKWLTENDTDKEVTSVEYIDGRVHLSTACTWDTDKHWALAKYFDDAVAKNILKDSDRNYFQVFSVAGAPNSLAFNCPRIVQNLDPGNSKDISMALISARQTILRLLEFCKKYFPGFDNAYIANISDQIGVRASKRIKGRYVYTIDDLRSGKTFDNPVLVANYPVDVHSSEKDSSILEKTGEYQLPIESLMSADYGNLFVAGRGLSADELAQGALRVQSSCFSMGEAVAKYIKSII